MSAEQKQFHPDERLLFLGNYFPGLFITNPYSNSFRDILYGCSHAEEIKHPLAPQIAFDLRFTDTETRTQGHVLFTHSYFGNRNLHWRLEGCIQNYGSRHESVNWSGPANRLSDQVVTRIGNSNKSINIMNTTDGDFIEVVDPSTPDEPIAIPSDNLDQLHGMKFGQAKIIKVSRKNGQCVILYKLPGYAAPIWLTFPERIAPNLELSQRSSAYTSSRRLLRPLPQFQPDQTQA